MRASSQRKPTQRAKPVNQSVAHLWIREVYWILKEKGTAKSDLGKISPSLQKMKNSH